MCGELGWKTAPPPQIWRGELATRRALSSVPKLSCLACHPASPVPSEGRERGGALLSFCCRDKHHDQKQLRGKKSFILVYTSRSKSITEQSLGRNLCTNHGGTLLFGWLTGPCSASFLTQPRTTCLRNGDAHSGLGPPVSMNS